MIGPKFNTLVINNSIRDIYMNQYPTGEDCESDKNTVVEFIKNWNKKYMTTVEPKETPVIPAVELLPNPTPRPRTVRRRSPPPAAAHP